MADISGYFGQLYSLITKKYELLNLQKVKLGKPKYWICSNQHAKEDFGFETRYSIEDGLRITFDWYKRNRWIKWKVYKYHLPVIFDNMKKLCTIGVKIFGRRDQGGTQHEVYWDWLSQAIFGG